MHILVTGGAGYIGSHTCKTLAQAGYTPIVYDNLRTGHKDFVQWGPLVQGDIRDTDSLIHTIHEYKVTGIIHFAALSCVGESVINPNIYYQNNVSGTLSILEAMLATHVQHIVVSSTCAVYGIPEIIPIDESTPINPINPYGASKSMMERFLADYHKAFGITGAALRYFNAAGADKNAEIGEWHDPETHLIPRVIMAAHGHLETLHVFGNNYPTPDGTCIRDYIHVTDLAKAHINALLHIQKNNQPLHLNLGTGIGYSVQEIIAMVEKILDVKVPVTMDKKRAGDPPLLVAQAKLAKEILGWKLEHSDLENIITTATTWYAKNTQNHSKQ